MAEVQEVEPSKPRTTRHQRGTNVHADSISEYWKRALYYQFVNHLIVELKDRPVIANDKIKAQYLIPSLVHELTPAKEDAIFHAFRDDFFGDRERFRCEVSRWRVRWSLKEQSLLS